MHGGPVDVYCHATFWNREVSSGDGGLTRTHRNRHLLFRMEAVRLEEVEEFEFEGRTHSRRIGFEPGTRVVKIANPSRPT